MAVLDVPETRYASDGDVRIAYQVFGDGPLDLLFAIGGQIPVDIGWEDPGFARFMRRLATFSRVVIFDSRGWGASRTAVDTAPTVEDWADDLRLVLDTVGIERAAVVGHYAGAVMSTFFAAAHPDRVSSLVLIEASARMLRDADYPIGMPAARARPPHRRLHRRVRHRPRRPDSSRAAACDDEPFRRWWARCERMANGPLGAGSVLARADARATCAPSCRRCASRRWCCIAATTRSSGSTHGRYLAEHIPDARYVELEGEDHLFFVGDIGPHARRDRALPDRRRRERRARPAARVGAVHRHRRLDRHRGRAGRPPLARAARPPRRAHAGARRRASAGAWSRRPATARSRRSTARRARSAARVALRDAVERRRRRAARRHPHRRGRAARRRHRRHRRAPRRARAGARRRRARCWCRARSPTSSRAPGSRSATAASTSSRASPAAGGSSPSRTASIRRI